MDTFATKAGLTMAEREPKDQRKDKNRKDEPNTEYDNFQDLLKKVLSAPKEEVDKKREEYEREKKKRAG